MEFNPQMQLAGLLEWMHERMAACYGKTAVIGISGGKDSSTVAALAVAAYGRRALSLVSVAMRASHFPQSSPQQPIS